MTSLARAAAVAAAVLTIAACGSQDAAQQNPQASSGASATDSASADGSADGGDASACATVDAPMLDIPKKEETDPVMAIPAPPGWERMTDMDSQIIRFALVNKSLVAQNFAPNVVVTLESIPGDVPADSVFEQQRATLVGQGGATDLETTTGTLCGEPSETTDYTGAPVGAVPARPVTVLLSVLRSEDRTFALTATVQTLDPENPTFVKDRDTILSGFRFLPPDA